MNRKVTLLFLIIASLLNSSLAYAWVAVQVNASSTHIPADGVSTSIITATVTHPDGSPWVGHNVNFSLSTQIGSINPLSGITNSSGQVTTTYTAGTSTATITITATDTWNLPNVSSSCYVIVDATPPTTPTVVDDGYYSTSSTSLHASWTSYDIESGITEYQDSLGTTPGGTQTIPWTLLGLRTEVTPSGLPLVQGLTYYFNVKAKNAAGMWSQVGNSDGITIDSVAPAGSIKINNDATYTNSTTVTLNLSATDSVSGLDKMQFSKDGINYSTAEAYSTTKSWTLSPGDGTKTVYVKFKDVAGNWTQQEIKDAIILDTTAPIVAITSPQDGFISATQPVTVSGTIDDNTATVVVKVNGTTEVLAQVSSGTFRADNVPLVLGPNTIVAIATDPATNQSTSNSITVTYQTTTVLAVDITSPANGARVNTSPITVSGTVSYSTATVTVNGISADVDGNTFTALGISLTAGTNIITARAVKDTETAEDSIDVILDLDPPSINIYTPDANATTRSNIVYGRVSDDTEAVTVNGTSAEILSDFRFIARPTLTEGANIITVEAEDQATNTNQASLDITYNTQTPKVTITSPLDNSTQNISPIQVQGTNTEDLSFIMVNLATALIDVTNFTAEGVILDSTKTVITASGYDASDNKFQDAIVINSPDLSHYEVIKVSGDATEDDPERPSAGANQALKVKLEKNGLPVQDEEVQFSVTQGGGMVSPISIFTDVNGEAQATLTTDTNSDITNQVECFPTSNPLVKMAFYVDTKPAVAAILIKITDDTVTPVPGATIPLIVKLTDSNNNPIQDETINFQVISGDGTISSPTAITTYYGEAKVDLTCPSLGLVLIQIQASSSTVPSVTVTFNITTSTPLTVTAEDLFNKVEWNAAKIQDQIVEVTVISDDPYKPVASQYRVWQKGELMKMQDMSTGVITIRPELTFVSTSAADIQIISCYPDTNIYAVKTRAADQPEETPYTVTYIDYSEGVVTRTESYYESEGLTDIFVVELSNFVQLPEANDVWVYNTKTKKRHDAVKNLIYTTTTTVINRQVNVGLTDADFQ